MEWYVWLIAAVAAAAVIFLAVVLGRAAAFRPHKEDAPSAAPVRCDEGKAVSDLAEMIRCKTVSDTDESREDDAEFEKFEALLPRFFTRSMPLTWELSPSVTAEQIREAKQRWDELMTRVPAAAPDAGRG